MAAHEELKTRLKTLKEDILHPLGIQVAQSQNYPFSLFIYSPEEEFLMREEFDRMIQVFRHSSIQVLEINLASECISLLHKKEGFTPNDLIAREKRIFQKRKDPQSSIYPLQELFESILTERTGLSASIVERVTHFKEGLEGRKGIVFITRAGFLFPFYRTSTLLNYIPDTIGMPIIFLYPGTRAGDNSLSYMGVLQPDSNYRPRIY